jgi:hypothetical protein
LGWEVWVMVAVLDEHDVELDRRVDPGGWLVAHRWEMDRAEAKWLETLAVFDAAQGSVADGQLSCIDWLMWRTGMAKATAYEKLRIARALARRPLLREAFGDGRLSYSAVRAMARMDDPDPEVDAALVEVACSGTVSDVERAVRCYQLHAEQDRLPADPFVRRGLRVRRGTEGTGTIEMVLEDSELEEVAAVLQAFLDARADSQPASAYGPPSGADSAAAYSPGDDRDDSAAAYSTGGPTLLDEPSWPARRADAFMDMVRVALAHVGQGQAAGADRYMVHVVTHADTGVTTLVDGSPVDAAVAARMACDCSTVAHVVGDEGEVLYVGRKTRDWNTPQRRAITVRDGGRCRFPGCQHRWVDIHHLRWWSAGGPTDIDNGLLICPRHHTMLHRGFSASGNANSTVTFHRPSGTLLGTTGPSEHPPAR